MLIKENSCVDNTAKAAVQKMDCGLNGHTLLRNHVELNTLLHLTVQRYQCIMKMTDDYCILAVQLPLTLPSKNIYHIA